MAKELLINVSEREECRIAVLEDKKLQELYMERTSSTSHVGNVYKGKVTNVEASIQAAFVDFGLGRNGFLHISDLMPTYFGRKGEDIQETVGRKMARRDRPPIQRCLRRGDEIVVQIIKEGIGTKGPTLTTYLSIPGKVLVMMPGVGKSGVSRKIEDEDERRRLRKILDELETPDDVGFIIRTAGVGLSKTEIQRDLHYLTRLWQTFKKKRDSGSCPIELYTEGDLITRTVRDVFTADVDRVVVDNAEVAERVKDVIKLANPRGKDRVELYEDPLPLFHKFGIEREIELMYSRHVPLQSGGSLVIDSTEAIVAIDVNSGKSRDFSDAEAMAFRTDMEAADEICRQLKLRDLGGVIICDFIDLRYERHRRELEERIEHNLKGDRAKTKVLRMSQFGIIEMTRQRMRPSLKRSVYFDCPHCKGAGLIKTPESMSLDVMRRLRIAINDKRVARLELTVCSDVAFYLQNKKREPLSNLEYDYQKQILIRGDTSLALDEMRIDLYDDRDGLVFIEELGMVPQPPHTTQLGPRPNQKGGRHGGRDDRNQRRQEPPKLPAPRTRRLPDDEEDIEDREEQFERDGEEANSEVVADNGELVAAADHVPDDNDVQPLSNERPPTQHPRRGRPHQQNRGGQHQGNQQRHGQQRDSQPRGGQPPAGQHRGGPERGGPDRGGRDRVGPQNRQEPHRGNQPPREIPPAQNRADQPNIPGPVSQPGGVAPDWQTGDQQEGGPKRRRRRRGRRGRGRNRQGQDGQPLVGAEGHPPVPDAATGGPENFSGEPDDGQIEDRYEDRDQHGERDQPGEQDRGYEREPDSESIASEHREDREPFRVENARPVADSQAATAPERDDRDDFELAAEAAAEVFGEREPESLAHDAELTAERRGSTTEPQPSAPSVESPAAKPETNPKRRRGTIAKAPAKRAAKPGAKKAPTAKAATPKAAPKRKTKVSATKSASKAGPKSTPRKPVSVDRHLVDDEPVLPQPVPRPRSVRDLDAIPDDYDE